MIRRLLLSVAGLVVVVAIVLAVSEYHLRRTYRVAARPVAELTDSVSLARGEHLYRSIACATCHAEDGGGAVYLDAGPIGLAAGPNLTRGQGGVGAHRSAADLARAIRHGVRPEGTSLLLMPSEVYAHLTDGDLGALIGYLRRLPPVDRELPATHLRLLGRALLAVGQLNLLAASKIPSPPDPGPVHPAPTAVYGRYLADIASCRSCHRSALTGGPMAAPGVPPAPNLTPAGLSGWSEADFFIAMRTGRRLDGSTLHEIMPWRQFRHMTDQELRALWRYLRSVPARLASR